MKGIFTSSVSSFYKVFSGFIFALLLSLPLTPVESHANQCFNIVKAPLQAFCASAKKKDIKLLNKLEQLLGRIESILDNLNQFNFGFDPLSCLGDNFSFNLPNFSLPNAGGLADCLAGLNLNFQIEPPSLDSLNGLTQCLDNMAPQIPNFNFNLPSPGSIQQCINIGSLGQPDFDTAIDLLKDIQKELNGILGGNGSFTPGFIPALKGLIKTCKKLKKKKCI